MFSTSSYVLLSYLPSTVSSGRQRLWRIPRYLFLTVSHTPTKSSEGEDACPFTSEIQLSIPTADFAQVPALHLKCWSSWVGRSCEFKGRRQAPRCGVAMWGIMNPERDLALRARNQSLRRGGSLRSFKSSTSGRGLAVATRADPAGQGACDLHARREELPINPLS